MPQRNHKRFAEPADFWQRVRGLFVDDWGLKLLALAITLVLWFMVSGRIAQREVMVEAKPEGKPAPTFEVKDLVATPAKIKIQGPANYLNEIDKLIVPISVEGRRESFDVSPVPLSTLDQNIQPLGTINVHVTIMASGKSNAKSPTQIEAEKNNETFRH
jgi:YbbR domain-containing protein